MTPTISALRPFRRAALGLAAALAATLLLAGGDRALAAAEPRQLPAADGTAQPEPIYLRGEVSVEGPMVTLGDVLVGIPDHLSEVPVARAPEPGGRGRVRTATIARVAQLHGLDWKPVIDSRNIEVTRQGRLVDQAELSRAILEALQPQLGEGDYGVYITGRARDHYVAMDADINPVVESIDYRPENGRFEASIRITGEPGERSLRLSGQVTEMTEVPVLRSRMENGQVITAQDITYRKVRADRIPANVLTDASALIGRTPRRAVQAGQHIRANDILIPQDVQRNDMVTMVVNHGGMLLTTTGQAMESGARGDVIGVRNLQSKRVVRGVIVGPGEVHMLVNHSAAAPGLTVGQAPARPQVYN